MLSGAGVYLPGACKHVYDLEVNGALTRVLGVEGRTQVVLLTTPRHRHTDPLLIVVVTGVRLPFRCVAFITFLHGTVGAVSTILTAFCLAFHGQLNIV